MKQHDIIYRVIGLHRWSITSYLAIFAVLLHPFSYYFTLWPYYFILFRITSHFLTYYFVLFRITSHFLSFYFILFRITSSFWKCYFALIVFLHPFGSVTSPFSCYVHAFDQGSTANLSRLTHLPGPLASAFIASASTRFDSAQHLTAKVEYILEYCVKYFLVFDICQEIIVSFKRATSFQLIASNLSALPAIFTW